MKKLFDIKRFKFYLWVGLVFLLLGLFSHYPEKPSSFLDRLFNNIWAVGYLTVLNYVFFEYTLSLLGWKRIFTFLLLILTHIFLYSCGSYIWRSIGIGLHIYTEFVTYPDVQKAIAGRMAYSMES